MDTFLQQGSTSQHSLLSAANMLSSPLLAQHYAAFQPPARVANYIENLKKLSLLRPYDSGSISGETALHPLKLIQNELSTSLGSLGQSISTNRNPQAEITPYNFSSLWVDNLTCSPIVAQKLVNVYLAVANFPLWGRNNCDWGSIVR